MVRRAKQRREAGTGVEAGETEPVDGPVAANEGDGLGVANERVIFDAQIHDS